MNKSVQKFEMLFILLSTYKITAYKIHVYKI